MDDATSGSLFLARVRALAVRRRALTASALAGRAHDLADALRVAADQDVSTAAPTSASSSAPPASEPTQRRPRSPHLRFPDPGCDRTTRGFAATDDHEAADGDRETQSDTNMRQDDGAEQNTAVDAATTSVAHEDEPSSTTSAPEFEHGSRGDPDPPWTPNANVIATPSEEQTSRPSRLNPTRTSGAASSTARRARAALRQSVIDSDTTSVQQSTPVLRSPAEHESSAAHSEFASALRTNRTRSTPRLFRRRPVRAPSHEIGDRDGPAEHSELSRASRRVAGPHGGVPSGASAAVAEAVQIARRLRADLAASLLSSPAALFRLRSVNARNQDPTPAHENTSTDTTTVPQRRIVLGGAAEAAANAARVIPPTVARLFFERELEALWAGFGANGTPTCHANDGRDADDPEQLRPRALVHLQSSPAGAPASLVTAMRDFNSGIYSRPAQSMQSDALVIHNRSAHGGQRGRVEPEAVPCAASEPAEPAGWALQEDAGRFPNAGPRVAKGDVGSICTGTNGDVVCDPAYEAGLQRRTYYRGLMDRRAERHAPVASWADDRTVHLARTRPATAVVSEAGDIGTAVQLVVPGPFTYGEGVVGDGSGVRASASATAAPLEHAWGYGYNAFRIETADAAAMRADGQGGLQGLANAHFQRRTSYPFRAMPRRGAMTARAAVANGKRESRGRRGVRLICDGGGAQDAPARPRAPAQRLSDRVCVDHLSPALRGLVLRASARRSYFAAHASEGLGAPARLMPDYAGESSITGSSQSDLMDDEDDDTHDELVFSIAATGRLVRDV